MTNINLTIKENIAGERLDKFLLEEIPDLSRTHIQKLIEEGQVSVNKKTVKPNYKVRNNDEINISLPKPKDTNIKAENIDLEVVYEDNDLLVINKPQGMITHPASGIYSGTLVNAVMHHCRDSLSGINGVLRPGIVHRLDKETSGLIIVCKNDKAHLGISKQLKDRKMQKYYLAIVYGNVPYDSGVINKPIGRDRVHRHKMAVVNNGRVAFTRWKVLKKTKEHTFLECQIETGRTHQIRVHLKSIGYPVVGDKTYGKKNNDNQMMLHAYKLVFIHPILKKEIRLETKLPERFKKLFN